MVEASAVIVPSGRIRLLAATMPVIVISSPGCKRDLIAPCLSITVGAAIKNVYRFPVASFGSTETLAMGFVQSTFKIAARVTVTGLLVSNVIDVGQSVTTPVPLFWFRVGSAPSTRISLAGAFGAERGRLWICWAALFRVCISASVGL